MSLTFLDYQASVQNSSEFMLYQRISRSGSCWALAVLYSGLSGSPPDPKAAGEHIKQRINKSYLDSSVLDVLTTPPLNKVCVFLRDFCSTIEVLTANCATVFVIRPY